MAEAALRREADACGLALEIDSAGTGDWHIGDPPDDRMRDAAARRGYDLSSLRARQVALSDFYEFDYFLAMDLRNKSDLLVMAPPNRHCDIRLFLDFVDEVDTREVPDPYFGGRSGFERAIDLIEAGAAQVVAYLERESAYDDSDR